MYRQGVTRRSKVGDSAVARLRTRQQTRRGPPHSRALTTSESPAAHAGGVYCCSCRNWAAIVCVVFALVQSAERGMQITVQVLLFVRHANPVYVTH